MWMILYILLAFTPQEAILLDNYLNVRGFEPSIADCKTLEKYGFHIEKKEIKKEEFNWNAWNAQYAKVVDNSGYETWVEKETKVLASK